MAALPARRGPGQGRGGRPPARAPSARGAVRGRPPPAVAAAPARQRPRRHRQPGGRRCAGERAPAAGRLPRRQPLHDLGLQVRAARGGGQAEKARLAGPRGAARAGDAGACSRAPGSSPTRSWSRASCWRRCSARRRGADAASAERPRRPGPERRPDRRARRASRHDARRALQDPARRPPQAATHLDDAGSTRVAGRRNDDGATRPEAGARPPARPGRARGRLRRVLRRSSTATSSSSWPAPTPTPRFRGCALTSPGCPACREEHESLRALVDK